MDDINIAIFRLVLSQCTEQCRLWFLIETKKNKLILMTMYSLKTEPRYFVIANHWKETELWIYTTCKIFSFHSVTCDVNSLCTRVAFKIIFTPLLKFTNLLPAPKRHLQSGLHFDSITLSPPLWTPAKDLSVSVQLCDTWVKASPDIFNFMLFSSVAEVWHLCRLLLA